MILFLITTTLGLLAFHAGNLLKPIVTWSCRSTADERHLLTQKAELKYDQSRHSMTDEFAKYSKLQRRINIIEEKLADLQAQRLKKNIIVRMICTYAVKLILGLLLIIIGFYYRNTPLFFISKRFSLYPLSTFISFPNNAENAVSVPFWITCCTTIGSLTQIES